MKNANVQNVLRVVVIAGGAIVTVGALMELTKTKIGAGWVMPIVTALVGASAFTYALSGNEIKVIPTA